MVAKPLHPHKVTANLKKRQAQDKIIALLSQGVKVSDACKEAGRTYTTYLNWRAHDKVFAAKADQCRLNAKDRTLGSYDFVDFRQTFFNRSTAVHHYRMLEAIEQAEPDSLTLVLAFPEAAKTSVMVDYINYKLGPIDPNYRIVAITEGQDLARKIVSQVTTRMIDEQQFGAYISRYGPFKAPDRSLQKPWNSDFVCLVQSSRDEKEPNLEAKGWGSKLYGGRYDLVWLDDIQTSETLAQTPQLLRYIRQTVLTRPAKGIGKTVVTGSSVGDSDIYATLQDEEMVDNLVVIPALSRWLARDEHFVKKGKEVALAEGCPDLSAWPDYWSMLDLAKRRAKVGEEIWTRTYMLREVYEAAKTFNAALVDQCKDPSRGLGRNGLGLDAVCSVDPALDSGIAGFVAAAYSTSNLWLLDAAQRTNLYRNEDILAIIAAWSAVYRPSTWIVEENNFQKGLARDERLQALAQKFGFRVQAHQTQRNKNDPVIGVSMMASAFSDQEISIPWGDDPAQQAFRPVCNELLAWQPKKRGTELKQNLVMALWFLWLHWEAERSRLTRASAPVRQQRPSWLRSA